MRTIQFDSVGGASGDMILGALADFGADLRLIQTRLAGLDIGPFEIVAQRVAEQGLTGTRVTVRVPDTAHPHEHRGLEDIRRLLAGSDLPARVKSLARKTFERLAVAEAGVHGTTPDKIHFHEVGAVDAIVDIVGSCLALEMLGVERITVGPLPLGRGTIECRHGVLPNPAPATVALLKGQAVAQTDETAELVTPTGAALLMEWKAGGRDQKSEAGESEDRRTDVPPLDARHLTLVGVGHGFGHFKLRGRPNLLRALLLETTTAVPANRDECLVLECNLDDITPELIGSLCQKLMAAGALDAFTTAVQMKKQRPAALLTVLCHAPERDGLVDLIFTESTTFGIREYATSRTVLRRRVVEVATPYGPVRVKIGTWKSKDVSRSPEFDDCVRCAEQHGVPVKAVYEAACRFTCQAVSGTAASAAG